MLGLVVFLFASWTVYNKMDEKLGGHLTERVTREESDESGRKAIWATTSLMIMSSSPEKFVIGHGFNGVRENSVLEISAHNDFLEIIYDYGFFTLYICLWIYLIRRCYFLYRYRSPLFLPYATSLSIMIVLSMVSQLLPYATYFNYLVMFWGMSETDVERQEKISKNYL